MHVSQRVEEKCEDLDLGFRGNRTTTMIAPIKFDNSSNGNIHNKNKNQSCFSWAFSFTGGFLKQGIPHEQAYKCTGVYIGHPCLII